MGELLHTIVPQEEDANNPRFVYLNGTAGGELLEYESWKSRLQIKRMDAENKNRLKQNADKRENTTVPAVAPTKKETKQASIHFRPLIRRISHFAYTPENDHKIIQNVFPEKLP